VKRVLFVFMFVAIAISVNAELYYAANIGRVFATSDGYSNNLNSAVSVGYYSEDKTLILPIYGEIAPLASLKCNLMVTDGKKPIPAILYNVRLIPVYNKTNLIGFVGLGYAFGSELKSFVYETGLGMDIKLGSEILQVDVGINFTGDASGLFTKFGFGHRGY
jgi:hypothetical protein